jgi:hypothetical protein
MKKNERFNNNEAKEKKIIEARINPDEKNNNVSRKGIVRGLFNDFIINSDFDEHFEERLDDFIRESNLDRYNISFFRNQIIANAKLKKAMATKRRDLNKADYEEKIMSEEAEKEVLRIDLEEKEEELKRKQEEKESYINSYQERVSGLTSFSIKKIPWYAITGVIIFLTIVFILSDSISIYDILSKALLSNKYLIVGLCVAVVTLLDFSPMPLANSILKLSSDRRKERIQAISKTFFITLAIVILYSAVIVLRFSHVDDYKDTLGTSYLKDNAVVNEIVTAEDINANASDSKAKAMVWLLTAEPIASSIVLLVLSLIHDRLKEENANNKELMEKRKAIDVEGAKIDSDIKRLQDDIKRIKYEIKISEGHIDYLDLNEKLYQNALEEIERVASYQQAQYLMELGKKLNNPDDISYVSREENAVL